MKTKIISVGLAILLIGLILPGCVSKAELEECQALAVEQEALIEEQAVKIAEQEDQIAEKEAYISELEELGAQIPELGHELAEKAAQITEQISQIEELEEKLGRAEGLRNPTYQELMDFVKEDKTNEHKYSVPDYQIFHFAADLNNNAEKIGIRAGYVRLWLAPSHEWCLVAFQTTDKGLVFIVPSSDEVVPGLVAGQDFKSKGWTEAHKIKKFVIIW